MRAATAVGTRMGPSARVDATSISNGLPIHPKDRRWATSTFGRVSSAAPYRLPRAPIWRKISDAVFSAWADHSICLRNLHFSMYSPTVTAAQSRVAGKHMDVSPRADKRLNGVRGSLGPPCKTWALASAYLGTIASYRPPCRTEPGRGMAPEINFARFCSQL